MLGYPFSRVFKEDFPLFSSSPLKDDEHECDLDERLSLVVPDVPLLLLSLSRWPDLASCCAFFDRFHFIRLFWNQIFTCNDKRFRFRDIVVNYST